MHYASYLPPEELINIHFLWQAARKKPWGMLNFWVTDQQAIHYIITSSAQYLKRTGRSLRQRTAVFKSSLTSGLSVSPNFLHSAWTHLEKKEEKNKRYMYDPIYPIIWCKKYEENFILI